MTEVMPIVERKSELCREIMSDLPEWFSVPEVVTDCADEAAAYPMLGCRRDGAVVGIVSLKEHAPSSAEVFVLGVRRRWHRQGIGRNLLCAAEEFARRRGMRLLTVKTLAPLDPDPPHYAATRQFYLGAGFIPAEVLTTLWDKGYPCLFMVKPLD